MIISVERAKNLIDLNGWTDERILMKLKAIEQTIRQYTNNNFQERSCRVQADIIKGVLKSNARIPFDAEDTIQISESELNNGLYTVAALTSSTAFFLYENVKDEAGVLVTKIKYPDDVIDCCLNLLEWEKDFRNKIGVKSETLSRHSVTYEDSASLFNGYPIGILGGVKKYKKVRC